MNQEPLVPHAIDASAATTGRSVLRGGFWYTASRIVPQFYALAISIVAARFLGPDGMGRQSFIAFVELSLAALLSNGLYFALMRLVGEAVGRRDAAPLRSLLRWAWWTQGALGLVGGGIMLAAALGGADPHAAWLLAAFVCTLTALHAVPSAVLIGAQRWRQASVVGLTTGFIATFGAIAALAGGYGITGMFAVEAVIAVLNLAWTTILARRMLARVAPRAAPADELRRQALRALALLSVSEILVLVVERRSEVFFLERNSIDSEIALYSIVFSVVTALAQVPYAMALAVSPAVATLFGAGSVERIRSGYERALRLLVISTLPLTAIGIGIGPALLRVIYGDEYAGTRPVLLIMMATFPAVPIAGLASALLTGIGRFRLLLAASAVAAVVDVALALLLTAKYHAVGAAIANAAAQVSLTALLLVFVYWLAGRISLQPATTLRAAVAASGTGLVGWASIETLGDVGGLVVGGVGALATFAALAVVLRILPARDAAWLDETLGAHLGGRLGRFFRLCAA